MTWLEFEKISDKFYHYDNQRIFPWRNALGEADGQCVIEILKETPTSLTMQDRRCIVTGKWSSLESLNIDLLEPLGELFVREKIKNQ
jgi:hypothetical protein